MRKIKSIIFILLGPILLASCQTDNTIGTGPLTLSPRVKKAFDSYQRGAFQGGGVIPEYFAVSVDGLHSGAAFCGAKTWGQKPDKKLACRDDDGAKALSLCAVAAIATCKIYARKTTIIWKDAQENRPGPAVSSPQAVRIGASPLPHNKDAEKYYAQGLKYAYGKGVPQDNMRAMKWFESAANQGHSGAKSMLLLMQASGKGIPKGNNEALNMYVRKAEQGDVDAQFTLGSKYSKGIGVPQNLSMAHMWFSIAALQGDEEAKIRKDWVEKQMAPADIETAQRLTKDWLREHHAWGK